MLQQYYGSEVSSRYSPPIHRSKSGSQQLHFFTSYGSRRSSSSTQRSSSLIVPARRDEIVRVNVSGRTFEFSAIELARYPGSLLSNPGLSGKYYDHEAKEYFFDRSRTAFECICTFYNSNGQLYVPEEYPAQLIVDELNFFGLYSYLRQKEKDSLVTPTSTETNQISIPENRVRRVVWQLLEFPESSLLAKLLSIFTLLVILFSITVLCAETLPSIRLQPNITMDAISLLNDTNSTDRSREILQRQSWDNVLFISETCCIVYFTLEVLLRFGVSPAKRRFFHKFMNIFDVIAIVPYYVTLVLETEHSSIGVAALRIFRLSRAFRILKISRYVSGMEVLVKTMRDALNDLWMMGFLTIIGSVLFASCVYYLEQFWDPDTSFESIPMSLWWAIITISTVGYGDMAPKTLAGRVAGAMCAVSGVLLIAPLLPIIYQRWERFYLLDQEAKLIKAAAKKKEDIETKGGKEKATRKDGKGGAQEGASTQEGCAKDKPEAERIEVHTEETVEAAPAALTSVADPDEFEIKKGDDIIWAHIRTASLKRKQSQNSFKLSPKQGDSIPEQAEPPAVNGRTAVTTTAEATAGELAENKRAAAAIRCTAPGRDCGNTAAE